ncbi:MAG: VWA-like domain-containing protein [Myxococcota bacterium]|nr:VWA-like domain-containing protein [Myxococcota bacterium]
MTDGLPTAIAHSVLRLRRTAPFYSVLCLHTEWEADASIGTAATDGTRIVYNPEFVASLSAAHLDGLVAHEVTHMAMRHCSRCRAHNPEKWNIAADIVTNGMVEAMGLTLPPGAIRDAALQRLSVEEVYRRLGDPLPKHKRKLGAREGFKGRDLLPGQDSSGASAAAESAIDAARWRDILRKALTIQRLHDERSGSHSFSALREIQGLLEPQLDWRTLLWRYVVQVPFDFAGWDRRFIHRGVYTEQLEGEHLSVAVCLDTSGSVDADMLRDLLSELQGIRRAHPSIEMVVYFADTKLYGPYRLSRDSELPIPVGGGGTSFDPFFEALDHMMLGADDSGIEPPQLAIYFTDGHAIVPAVPPDVPVMWLVPLGQRTSFPWGEVVLME